MNILITYGVSNGRHMRVNINVTGKIVLNGYMNPNPGEVR